jgi:ureidoacrylate peracid hydrolase
MDESADPLLDQILSPEWAALLVVDVQNDFCHIDGLFGRAGFDLSAVHAAAERLEPLIDCARNAAVPVIFIRLAHDALTNSHAWNHRGERPRADACVEGTWGADFYKVKPAKGDAVVLKRRYSPFAGTDLEYVLRASGRRSLLVAGVATNICVEQTLRDGFMHDYHVVLISDCAGAYESQAHASTVSNVRQFLGRTINSGTACRRWQWDARQAKRVGSN